MARKRKTNSSGSTRGPQIVTIILIAGIVGFLISAFSTAHRKLTKFHQSIFNATDAVTRYSFSPEKLAIVITSTLVSKPSAVQQNIKQLPLLNLPMRFKITHYVGLTSHVGTIELLSEEMNSNFKTNFQMEDEDNLTFQSSAFNYKDLGQEINVGNVNGKMSATGNSELSINNLEFKNSKFQFTMSGIQLNYSKPENKAAFKASELNINGIKLSAPIGQFNKNDKTTKISFNADFAKNKIAVDQTTEFSDLNGKPIPVTYGTYQIPIKVVDAIFDPGINAGFSIVEKELMAKKDAKQILIHQLTKELNRESYKMKMLQLLAHARQISKDADYFKINISKEDAITKQTRTMKDYFRAEEKAEEWIKAGGEKTFELAMYNMHFSFDFYIPKAVDSLLFKLAKTHANDPLYNLLKARLIVKRGYISYQNWTPESLANAEAILSKLNSEHKFADLIHFKIFTIKKDIENRNLYLQKFLEKETDPVIKALAQSEKFRGEDPLTALKFLDEAHSLDPKHYAVAGYQRDKVNIYGDMKDYAAQEAIYKELVSLPEPHLFDLINYSGILVDQKRYKEAEPIVKKCYEMTSPGNFCYSRHEVVTVKLAYEKNAANDKEGAIKDIEQLLITQPTSMQAYYALGWITHKTDIDKSIKYYSITCALGGENGCLYAADRYHYEKKDSLSAIPYYEIACEKKVPNACTKLGFRFEEKAETSIAQSFFKKACIDQKDGIGCYHLGRSLHIENNVPKEEVANYLDMTCKNLPEVCKLASSVRSGKRPILPHHPPGPLVKNEL